MEENNVKEKIAEVNKKKKKLINNNFFRTLKDSLIYVERTQADGRIRKGLMGKVDLEDYSFAKDSQTLIRATEGTVLERIPPRVKVRENAPLELPHIMLLIDDDKKEIIDNTLGIYLSKLGKKQLRIAETEKYAHVTYFFDGGRDLDLNLCDRVLIPSPKVATYDLKPEMSAREITSNLLEKMDNNYDFIFLNFANGDMVGHTGNYDMTKKAIETIDEMIGKLYKKCVEDEYLFIITADHGNAEEMIDENGNVVTSHTTNLVPFIVTDKNLNIDNVNKLSDIAPFVLNYMNLNLPDEMK